MTEEKHLTEKQVMKKRLINDLIELIIGLVLLRMCYGYINSHPAEKVSFFSGYKVIYQQTEIFFQNIFGNNGNYLKQKYELESYYQVLINLAEENSCIDAAVFQDLQDTYNALKAEPKNSLEHTLPSYIAKEYEFDDLVRVDCDTLVDDDYEAVESEEGNSDSDIIDID